MPDAVPAEGGADRDADPEQVGGQGDPHGLAHHHHAHLLRHPLDAAGLPAAAGRRARQHADHLDRGDRHRRRARHGGRRHGDLHLPLAAHPRPHLHGRVPRTAGDPHHPAHRPGLRPVLAGDLRTVPVPAGHPGAVADRGRLHRRDLPRRHPERREGAAGGVPRPRAELRQGDAPGRRAAGHPPRPPGPGQPVHRHREGLEPRVLPRPAGRASGSCSASGRTPPC